MTIFYSLSAIALNVVLGFLDSLDYLHFIHSKGIDAETFSHSLNIVKSHLLPPGNEATINIHTPTLSAP